MKKYLFVILAALALAGCGGSGSPDMGNVSTSGTTSQTGQTLSSTAPGQTGSTKLLDSLAVLYPNGQLPAERAAQATQDLAQNPAALKLTAETSTAYKSQVATNTSITAQAVAADYQPVQRVQNTTLYGAYFFSIFPSEITTALDTNPNWRLEGPAFWASLATGSELFPVHRFRNKINGSYLYSIYETERAVIATNYAATFAYEGVAWYARQTPATGWSALYRFRNKTNGTYLFSAYESEKNAIVATYPDVFALEGIAYYVRQDAQADPSVALPAITSIAPVSPATAVLGVSTTFTAVGENLPLTAMLFVQDATCLAASGNTATGFSQVCTINLGSTAGAKTITVKTASAGTVINSMNTITAQLPLSPVVTLTGSARVIANTIYTYSATVANATASAWSWLWGDGSANGSTNPTNKVWYKPGSYTTSVTTTVNGAPASASQTVTVVGDPIVGGGSHSCALKPDGTVTCWGDNTYGQLGDGSTTRRLSPTAVPGLTGVAALAAGGLHSCALKTDGVARCWGYNGQGQLGDGSTTDRLYTTAVVGLTGVVALAAGDNHSCALKTDGVARCWGFNAYGQLGDGSTTTRVNPTAVPDLTGVVALAAGSLHSCALKGDGTVWCWGWNFAGQLGDGSTTNRLSPTPLGLTGVVALTAGTYHSCALKPDGTVSCWGRNDVGQLGDGSTTDRLSPTAIPGLTGVVALAAGYNYSCALKTDGTVSCWGNNGDGQLGDGSTGTRLIPTAVPGLTGVAALTAGGSHSCALKADGTVSCWGRNGNGQLGDNSTTNRSSPVDVLGGAVFWK